MSSATPIITTNVPNTETDATYSDNPDNNEISSFDELGLKDTLLRGIYSMGYSMPSEIQRKAIRPMMTGNDIIAQAQSGTGKTATFLIGSLQQVDPELFKPQVIILCPNHELAQQIYYNYDCLAQYMRLRSALLIGGTSVDDNIKSLDKGVQFIVGTPGRVYDMMKRYVLKTDKLRCFVIDEADEMLDRGFKDQLYEIVQFIPSKCQMAIFSATMPPSALELTQQFMNPDATRILVQPEHVTLDGIKQYYLGVDNDNWKFDTLCELYERLQINQTIIFVNSRRKAEAIKEKLEERNFTVGLIYGEMKQMERDRIMRSFRTGDCRIMIATDVIARGIDVQQVSVVINYDIPRQCETYIHRIGRTGRYGRKGVAINFVTVKEVSQIEKLQRFYDTKIDCLPTNLNDIL
jgi:translation initiation factor 4A